MEAQTILKKLDHIENLPTLPSIVMEVNKMLQDNNTSIQQLSGVIERDQALASKILRLVNSAFFGLRSKVGSIPHAITLLGLSTIRNAIISVSIIDTFTDNTSNDTGAAGHGTFTGFKISDFWRHSIAVAVTSKYLSEMSRLYTVDESFIGGLLHDMGKVILFQFFHDHFREVWRVFQTCQRPFYQIEKDILGVDHAQIGAHIAQRWQLPVELIDTIRFHHDPKEPLNGQNLLITVYAANLIVNNLYIRPSREINPSEIPPRIFQTLKTPFHTVPDWFPDVSSQIDSACTFFISEDRE
jgi:putative nucleotidyltransferase with HDIG domain